MKSALKLISIGVIGYAAISFMVASGWLIYSWSVLANSVRVTGTVVSEQARQSVDGGIVYHPVFEFQDREGVKHTVASSSGSTPPRFPVGSSVPVLYLPSTPSEAKIRDPLLLWLAPAFVFLTSLIMGVVGWFIGRLADRQGAEPNAPPNSRPPSQFLTSPPLQSPDSQRASSSGGCG